jgi:hypothetical protein
MTQEYNSAREAKRSLKAHIEFMETLIKHLNGTDKLLRGRACYAAWCLHRYFNDKFMSDLHDILEKSSPKDGAAVQ